MLPYNLQFFKTYNFHQKISLDDRRMKKVQSQVSQERNYACNIKYA